MLINYSFFLFDPPTHAQGDGDGTAATAKDEEEDIGDLDDLLRKAREMEKKRKESEPDTEVR